MYDFDEVLPSPLFESLSKEEVRNFLNCVQPRVCQVPEGMTIYSAEDPVDSILLVLKGQLLLIHDEYSGHSSILDHLSPGDLYGQEAVFCKEARSLGRLTAAEDSTYLLFSPKTFYQHCSVACHAHQTITRNMLQILSRRLTRLNQKIAYLSCASLKSKVSLYLLHQSQDVEDGQPFTIPFNREALAAYLNTQRPSLSRILTQMKEEGLIDYNRSTFRILDEEGLRRVD